MGYLGCGSLLDRAPSMWASREGEVPVPGCPERADHPASRYPEGIECPVLSGHPACRHPEMMGIQLEGTLRRRDTSPVGVLRVGIWGPVLQLGSVMLSHETLGGQMGSGLVEESESP